MARSALLVSAAAALCLAVVASGGALASSPQSTPVETIAYGPLWQAAQRSVGQAQGRALVKTPALSRWARSGEAQADLLTVVDSQIEAVGHFDQAFFTLDDAAFVDDALAAAPGPTARLVLAALVGEGVRAANVGAAAERLFPGPAGLEALLAESGASAGPDVRPLLTAYGLAGQVGAAYVSEHPADTSLITALAAQAGTARSALALWRGLRSDAAQTAFLAAWPYGAPPGAAKMMATALPFPLEQILVGEFTALPYDHSAASVNALARALDRLANRYGVAHSPTGVPVGLMQAALTVDPGGYLARSVGAYDSVREAPYFGLARCHGSYSCWPYTYGPAQYNVARELKGWPGFLRAYAKAPGADDAAYRLGRVEELSGRLAAAVETFYAATRMPDGDTTPAAYEREVWVLDTEMAPAQLEAMLASPLPSELSLEVRYSLAVDQLRAGRYAQAAGALSAVARALGGRSPVPTAVAFEAWPFAAAVRIQASEATALAHLSAKAAGAPTAAARAQDAYDLAAYMYHRTLLFYNQLWAGALGDYPWLGYQPFEPTPSLVSFESGENNFVQAARRFLALSRDPATPPALRAESLYSYGMSLYDLGSYNSSISVLWSPASLTAATGAAFTAFARAYPRSALAPEALTLAAAFTSSRAVLRQLVERYGHTAPGRDAASDLASSARWPAEPPPAQGPMAVQAVFTTTPGIPRGLRAWAAAPGPTVEARAAGGYTYIRVRPPAAEAGLYPSVLEAVQVEPDAVSVLWGLGPPAVGDARPLQITPAYALVRVPGTMRLAGSDRQSGRWPVGSDETYY